MSVALTRGVNLTWVSEQTGVAESTLKKHYGRYIHSSEADALELAKIDSGQTTIGQLRIAGISGLVDVTRRYQTLPPSFETPVFRDAPVYGVTPRGDFKSRPSPATCNELQRIVVDSTGPASRRLRSVVDLCSRNGASKARAIGLRRGWAAGALPRLGGKGRSPTMASRTPPSLTKPDLGTWHFRLQTGEGRSRIRPLRNNGCAHRNPGCNTSLE